MSSRRCTLLIVSAVAIIGSAALTSWHFYLRSRITSPDKFDLVRVGMTRQEVVAILGPPLSVGTETVGTRNETWESGRCLLVVSFERETVLDSEIFVADDSIWVWLRQLRGRLGL